MIWSYYYKLWKREKMIKKQKTEVMVIKRQKTRRRISLFSEEKNNYKSNIRDEIEPDWANNRFLLQL